MDKEKTFIWENYTQGRKEYRFEDMSEEEYLASLYSLESTSEIRQQKFERVQKLTALNLKKKRYVN